MRAQQTTLPASAAARPVAFTERMIRAIAAAWRLSRNRRAIRQLQELSDWELRDIGLERQDIAQAYRLPIYEDPTRCLQGAARRNAEAAIRRRP